MEKNMEKNMEDNQQHIQLSISEGATKYAIQAYKEVTEETVVDLQSPYFLTTYMPAYRAFVAGATLMKSLQRQNEIEEEATSRRKEFREWAEKVREGWILRNLGPVPKSTEGN